MNGFEKALMGMIHVSMDGLMARRVSSGVITLAAIVLLVAAGGASSATAITTCEELQNISNNLSGDYYLAYDINCSGFDYGDGKGFMPIGTFSGTFDGRGHRITNLYINRLLSTRYLGLFEVTGSGAVIKNVGLEEMDVCATRDPDDQSPYWKTVGGLVGQNHGTIESSYSAGNIRAYNMYTGVHTGGLVGTNWASGTIENSYSTGNVSDNTGSSEAGGLVGANLHGGTIENSYSTDNVIGSCDVGGLVGQQAPYGMDNPPGGTTKNSYSTGRVSSPSGRYVAGLVGSNYCRSTITNSYWDIYRSNQDICADTHGIGATTNCTGINANNSEPDYWYYSSNPPMDQWDFDNVWGIEEGVTYPFLQWERENLPDLIITEKSESWVDFVNKTYNITYTVKNIDAVGASETTTAIIIDGTEAANDSVGILAPQEEHTAELGPFTMTDGTDTIKVCADNNSVIPESDEENNCLENVAEVDLMVVSKTEDWVSMEDETYNITYTVKNNGTMGVDASDVGIYIDGVFNRTVSTKALTPNEEETKSIGPFTMTDRSDTIKVCADNDSIIPESDEENNCLENVAEVDLVVVSKSEDWVSEEGASMEDKTYNITYTVKNTGTIATDASDAGIYIDGVFNRTVPTKALVAGEEETKTIGPFTMAGENDTIEVCADNNSVVPEINETNNCLENLFEFPTVGCVADDGTLFLCGMLVTESCTFIGNLNCTDTTKCGLVVGADNIVINGAGYTLNGSVAITTCPGGESSPAVTHSGIINTGGYNDVVIKDVEIQNFCTGIVMGPTLLEKMTVTGCKIHDCGQTTNSITHGIHVVGAGNCTITKNEIYNISGDTCEFSCGGGGNGIFMFGGQQGDWEHGSGDHNTITCNTIYDVTKTGIFMKMGCMHNYISHNNITGCPESGINPMCMASNYNTYEYNNLSNNIGGGFSTGGSYNTLRFNTAHNNGDDGVGEYNTGNIVTNNSACGNGYTDIGGDICYNNTCGSGCGCDWNCNNLTPVYFDFDNDGHYSNTTENCTCSNILGAGSCCNQGLFNASHAAILNASGICWLIPGDDPNDCDLSIPDAEPDLVITEKSEVWISLEDKTYNVTYTIMNIGNADANASTTSIRTDGTEVATDPVEALPPQATHTAELGPFTMSDDSDTIRICADKNNSVEESNEDNNCKENIFKFHGLPDLVISKKYEEWVASNETYSNYTITYTVKNIGTGDANESTTSIHIDGTEVAADPVGALDEGESYQSTLGPFTMSGVSDTIRVCADNESTMEESNETNNCLENTFNHSETGCLADDGTLFRCGNTVTKSCTFNGDVICASGAGLIIGTGGITINGNDHRLTGTTTPDDCDGMGSETSPCTVSGIYNSGFDNVAIKNLEIDNFCTGIALAGTGADKVGNITVNNCSIHDNGFNTGNMATHGIHACNIAEGAPDAPALTITESEIYNNEGTGSACGSGGNGIFIFAGSGDKHEYCNISHNRLHNNAKAGFWTKMMLTRSEIVHNEIWGNGYGTGITDDQRGGIVLRCKMSNENLIAYNDVHDNNVDGIFIGGSSNIIEYNNATNNTDDGIDMGRSDGSYDNELYENTVCENGDNDISTFGAGSNTTGDDNICDTTENYDDTGTTGCTHLCGGSAGTCGDVDGLPGVTTNDGRHIFMYLLYNGAEPYSIDEDTLWAADCDGLCDGITTNDGRHIFMHLLHGEEQYPLNCSC